MRNALPSRTFTLLAILLVPLLAGAQDRPAPAVAAPPAPAPSAAPAAPPVIARPMSEQPQAQAPKAGGTRGRKRSKPAAVQPQGPVATYPGFKMLEDGGSRVFVEISRKVEITEHKAEGRVTYRMKGV